MYWSPGTHFTDIFLQQFQSEGNDILWKLNSDYDTTMKFCKDHDKVAVITLLQFHSQHKVNSIDFQLSTKIGQ